VRRAPDREALRASDCYTAFVHSSVPFIVAAMLGNVVLVLIFGWLWRERRLPWLRWWTLSFASAAARYAFSVVATFHPDSILLYFSHQLATALSALFLLAGTADFVGKRTPRWGSVVVALGLLWSLVAHAQQVSFALTTAPLFFTLAIIMIHAGVVLLRSVDDPVAGRTIAGIALIAHGIHRFDYPFLRNEEWFQPWGFLLAAVCELMMGVGFLVGVFERTRVAATLHELRYREFFERSPAGFFRASPEGVLLDANPAFLRLLGCTSLDEARALPEGHFELDSLRRDSPVDREASHVDVNERAHADTFVQEWKAKDGASVLVTGAMRLVNDREGHTLVHEGFVRDVTLERRLDAQLKHAQRSELVGRLAGGIAHDFNNLLTVIAGNVSLLRDVVEDLPGESEQLLNEIVDATEQANALTRQMLALAKKTPFTRQLIDVAELVARNRAVLKRLVGKEVQLVVDTQQTARVYANPSNLDQVLLNLVINARDAMPDGGVITLSTSLDASSGDVLLRVSDTGVGMSPDVIEHIFEPFFTTKDVGHGTGLGLPVVESVVTQLGGDIAVESTPGRGTTFTVRLPVSDARSTATRAGELPIANDGIRPNASRDDSEVSEVGRVNDAPRGPEPTSRADDGGGLRAVQTRIRVLLVDDDPAIARLMERGLSARGVDVETCDRAPSALAILSKGERFDLLASDITMPEMDGIAFARVVAERYPTIPVILMSGFAERVDEIADNPAVRVLEKPFTVERFLAVIHETLGR
jgi:two-component system cell cycle sensor histidine kinase/response regulator CckA